jgi:hypothetical protein
VKQLLIIQDVALRLTQELEDLVLQVMTKTHTRSAQTVHQTKLYKQLLWNVYTTNEGTTATYYSFAHIPV